MTHPTRRTILATTAAALAAPLVHAKSMIDLDARKLAELERKSGGRLGVFLLDTGTGRSLGHRVDERFAMCSTFKMALAAAILQRVDQGKLALDAVVPYTRADLLAYAPVTEANLAKGGMTIGDLAQAAQKQSDNAAANLLLKQIGGPEGFTQFFRSIGDGVTRLDRYEPHMNDVKPGDERDTTTPAAMAATMAKILTGELLAPASRALLIDWMIETKTGAKRIRAGLPAGWRAGDKTGTSGDGKYNDIAIAWPSGKAPLIITAYFNAPAASSEMNDENQAVLAEVGRIAAAWGTLGTGRTGE